MEHLESYEFLKFDSYSKKISNSLASSVSTKLSRYICYPDWEARNSCLASHAEGTCYDCALSECHQSLLDDYPDHFYIGDDKHPEGIEYSHPGVHVHAHCADAFYAELEGIYVK
jgi:hypothetical protein